MKFPNTALVAAAVAVSAGHATAAGPGGYPAKPVTIVVPFAPAAAATTSHACWRHAWANGPRRRS